MSCKHIKDILADYIGSTLNQEGQARVESHLEHCESCREELEFLKSYYRGLEILSRVEAPINLLDSIHAGLEKPQGFKERYQLLLHKINRIKLPLEIAGIAAAAALFLFVISPFREMEIGGKKSTYVAMEKIEDSLPEVEDRLEEVALDEEMAAPPEELEKQRETVTEQRMVETEEPVQRDETLLLSNNVEVTTESDERVVLNRVDDSRGELEESRLNEEKADLAEVDSSYEVALVLRTLSSEESFYQAEQDYTVQKSKRSFATKDLAQSSSSETSGLEEQSANEPLPQEEGLAMQISSLVASFAGATIELSYQADGVTPKEAIIKVKTTDYSKLVEQLTTLGLVEGPQVDPATVITAHMRVVLRLE